MYVTTPDTPDIAKSIQAIEYNTNLMIVFAILAFASWAVVSCCKMLAKHFDTL